MTRRNGGADVPIDGELNFTAQYLASLVLLVQVIAMVVA